MRPDDRDEFLRILNGLAAIKPGGKLTPEALDIWWTAMSTWSIGDFSAAASVLARSIEFMPSPYHFEQLRKAGQPTPGEAWAKAVDAAGSCYRWGALTSGGTCGDAAIDQAVRMIGGYRAIAMCDFDKLHFLERRFCEHYADVRDAADIRKAVPTIANEQPAGVTGPRRVLGGPT